MSSVTPVQNYLESHKELRDYKDAHKVAALVSVIAGVILGGAAFILLHLHIPITFGALPNSIISGCVGLATTGFALTGILLHYAFKVIAKQDAAGYDKLFDALAHSNNAHLYQSPDVAGNLETTQLRHLLHYHFTDADWQKMIQETEEGHCGVDNSIKDKVLELLFRANPFAFIRNFNEMQTKKILSQSAKKRLIELVLNVRNRMHEECRAKDKNRFSLINSVDIEYEIDDLEQTSRLYEFAVKAHGNREITLDEFESVIGFVGKGISFNLGDDEFSSLAAFLCGASDSLPHGAVNTKLLVSILINADASVMQQFRERLQKLLNQGFEAFQKGEIEEEPFRAFVFNIVALMPYSYPLVDDRITVPVKINGEWKTVVYKVDRVFEMSPDWLSSPLPVYGLKGEGAPPIIACLGSTFPGGKGYVASLLSDCTPGMSVGHAASLYGREEISEWLIDKTNVIVAGLSLGGALSMHISRQHSEQIKEVYAFVPAGLYPGNWADEDIGHIRYHIYSNENDLVSTMGMFPTGKNVTVYRVLADKKKDPLFAHSTMFYGAKTYVLLKSSPEFENNRPERIVLTGLHMLFSPLAFIPVFVLNLLSRPYQ